MPRDHGSKGPWLLLLGDLSSHISARPSSPHVVSWPSSAHVASIYPCAAQIFKYIFELEHTLLLYISQQWQLSKLFSLGASHFSLIPSLIQTNHELFFHFCQPQWKNNIPTAMCEAASENPLNSTFPGTVYRLCVWYHASAHRINYSGGRWLKPWFQEHWLRTTRGLEHLLAVQSWASSIYTLCLSFLIWKLGIILFPSEGLCDG